MKLISKFIIVFFILLSCLLSSCFTGSLYREYDGFGCIPTTDSIVYLQTTPIDIN